MLATTRDFESSAYGPAIVVSPHEPPNTLASAAQTFQVDVFQMSTAAAALQTLPGVRPSLIVVDDEIEDLPAAVLIRLFRGALPNAPIVGLAPDERNNELVVAGADVVVQRTAPADDVLKTVSLLLQR